MGEDKDYYLYTVTKGSSEPIYTYEDPRGAGYNKLYYPVGKLALKSNNFFILASGIRDKDAYAAPGCLHIKLPDPKYCIGQTIVITNKSTGFPSGSLLLEQEYVHNNIYTDGAHYICMTTKELLKNHPNYPYGTYGSDFKDGEPVLGGGTWTIQEDEDYVKAYSAPQGLSSINGIWLVGNNNFPTILTELDLNDYEWVELVAVGWNVESKMGILPQIVDTNFSEFNTQWMVTRWKEKSNS